MGKITSKQVFDHIKKLVEENPDKQNPVSTGDQGAGCLYTAETDPSSHCVVGQVLNDFGLPVPDPTVILGFTDIVEDYLENFTGDALNLLEDIQRDFDNGSFNDDNVNDVFVLCTWKQAFDAFVADTNVQDLYNV